MLILFVIQNYFNQKMHPLNSSRSESNLSEKEKVQRKKIAKIAEFAQKLMEICAKCKSHVAIGNSSSWFLCFLLSFLTAICMFVLILQFPQSFRCQIFGSPRFCTHTHTHAFTRYSLRLVFVVAENAEREYREHDILRMHELQNCFCENRRILFTWQPVAITILFAKTHTNTDNRYFQFSDLYFCTEFIRALI